MSYPTLVIQLSNCPSTLLLFCVCNSLHSFSAFLLHAISVRYMAHFGLIDIYSNSIRQQHPGDAIIKKNVRLSCIKFIYPDTVWFKIVEVPCFGLSEVSRVNDEYIHKSSTRVRHIFNQTRLCRYPQPWEVVS